MRLKRITSYNFGVSSEVLRMHDRKRFRIVGHKKERLFGKAVEFVKLQPKIDAFGWLNVEQLKVYYKLIS